MAQLANKTALITGGTSPLGLATARQFRADGARVAITGTDANRLKAAQRLLGGDVMILRAETGDIRGHHEVAHTIAAAFGTLDALVIHTGMATGLELDDWDDATFDHTIATDLKGPFFLIQALLPLFANPASVVISNAMIARVRTPRNSLCAATRVALISLASTLSAELFAHGIRVNAVTRGASARSRHVEGDVLLDVNAAVRNPSPPQGRILMEQIAMAAAFLVSDASAGVVGSQLVIGGGTHER